MLARLRERGKRAYAASMTTTNDPPAPVHLARWVADMTSFLSDFEHDTIQDWEADPEASPIKRTSQEWLDALLEYRDATGAL